MKTRDVIIVGAGPAGSALANHLARAGLDALLVDRARFPRDKVCGELMNPRAIQLLDRLGCFSRIEALGHTKIRGCDIFLDGELECRVPLPQVPGCVDYAHAVPRHVLDEIIFRRAQEMGAQTLEECQVREFEVHGDGVVANVEQNGKRLRLAARMIVGADGAESTVARIAGLSMHDDRYMGLGIRSYGEDYAFEDGFLSWDRDYFPGLAWAFPSKGGGFNIGVGTIAEKVRKDKVRLHDYYDRFCALVDQIARRSGFRPKFNRPRGWALKHYGGAHKNYFERGLLIGDAGSFADPLTGEGIPMALETAKLASEPIEKAFATGDFSAGTLAEYERRWKEHYDLDSLLADFVVTAARNPHLKDLYMDSMRTFVRMADRDEQYAWTLGGVYIGILPMRRTLSPEFLVRPLLNGPQAWIDILGLSQERPLPELARRTLDGVNSSLAAWRGMLEEPERSLEWMLELSQKQRRLWQNLSTRSREVSPPFSGD